MDQRIRLICITGFLGGFTTYSAFALETVEFVSKGRTLSALTYAISTLCFAGLACWIGLSATKRFL
jgi:CrcB protein